MDRPADVYMTGATGFIGRSVAAALHRRGAGPVALGRQDPGPAGARWVTYDLQHPIPEEALAGCRTLVHAASYVGRDTALQQAVNAEGTRGLVASAVAAGVERIVYVSTAGVYGRAFPLGQAERTDCQPASTLSASRYEAEKAVLDAGGTVVRPNLVYGPGDRWFLAPLIGLMQRIGGWVGDGTARLSVIDSSTLGDAVAALALAPHEAGVYHAAHPRPITVRGLLGPLLDQLVVDIPDVHHDPAALAAQLGPHGISPAQIATVSQDHWFDTTRLWSTTWVEVPRRGPTFSAAALDWYRSQLRFLEDKP